MHCQITAGLLEGWTQWKRLEKRKRKGRQQQRWLRYRLSATVNRHRRSLSPRVVFRLRSQSPGKVILPHFFSPPTFILSLACSLFHQRDSSLFAFTFSRSLRVLTHRPDWPARHLFAAPGNLLPFLSSLVEIIRKMEVFLPWRKVRFVRRSRGLETEGGR